MEAPKKVSQKLRVPLCLFCFVFRWTPFFLVFGCQIVGIAFWWVVRLSELHFAGL